MLKKRDHCCIYPYLVLACLIGCAILAGCNQRDGKGGAAPLTVQGPVSDGHFQVMIEIPAGSNLIISYNPDEQKMDTVMEDSLPLVLDYLPYPVNQGFIPTIGPDSSLQKAIVWLLGRQIEPGRVISAQPLAMLEYVDNDEEHIEFLMVPTAQDLRTVSVEKFRDLIIEYDPVKYNIEHWLRNRYGIGRINSFVWKDEAEAHEMLMKLINQFTPPPL